MINFIVDALFVILVCAIVALAYKKGLFTAVAETLSVFIAGGVSYLCTPKVADFVYRSYIATSIKQTFTSAVTNEAIDKGLSTAGKIEKLMTYLPDSAVRLAKFMGVDLENLIDTAVAQNKNSAEDFIALAVDKIAYQVMIFLIEAVCFILLFVLLAVAVRFIGRLVGNLLNKTPVLGTANKVAGGVFGLVKAVIMVVVVSTVMYFAVGFSENETVIAAISNSRIYAFITANNPLLSMLN